MTTRRRLLMGCAAVVAAPAVWCNDAWPNRPLRMVTGSPGSVSDTRARWLSERLARALGQPVVIENNAGAGGSIGAEAVARSAPDGYTLLFIHQGIAAVNPHLYTHLGYEPLTDFAPVARFGHGPLLMAVNANNPATSVVELIRLAKDKPGALTFGSPGIGTPPHLASALFVRAAGIEAVHVPYKGGGALMTALLGGEITWSIEGTTVQIPHVRSGRLRALAVTGSHRSPVLPDVPTVAEAGVPGYEFAGWTGVAAPAATPKPVVARLNLEINRIMITPEAREWFAALGTEPGELSPEALAEFIRAEHAKWGKVIREVGIKVE